MFTSWSQSRSINQWASVLSLLAVFVLLTGVTTIAAAPGSSSDRSGPSGVRGIAQGTPEASPECVAYGPPPKSNEELAAMSMADWPARSYIAESVADSAVGREATAVYNNWRSCALVVGLQSASNIANPPAALTSYLSDRMQYVSFLGSHPERAPDELVAANAFGHAELITYGALPLNRPLVEVWNPEIGGGFPSFSPGDLQLLADGRYGVVIGTISTEELQWLHAPSGPQAASDVPPLQFLVWVAFVEVEGQLLIDEYVTFCPTPLAALEATPASADPYPEAQRLANCRPMGT
jgi:hypothetical protein